MIEKIIMITPMYLVRNELILPIFFIIFSIAYTS